MGHCDIKVIIEKNIPFIKGVLDPYARTVYLPPEEITRDALMDADALITRTRTKCDAHLLAGTKCRFIATATIGTDHIDLDYCRDSGVTVRNAPGCNAPAVAQYVLSAIGHLCRAAGTAATDKTLGIVGVGHVGKIVERWARAIGMNVLLCDPPRAEKEGPDRFCDMSAIACECDIITFHTPLSRHGAHPTYHLLDRDMVDKLAKRPVVINSSRGSVTDTDALLYGLEAGKISHAVIDCWENEPYISLELLHRASIATPHIAGYSKEGKIRATQMAINALTAHFGMPEIRLPLQVPEGAAKDVTIEGIMNSYDPMSDTDALKAAPGDFESLRNRYNLREEVR